MEYKNKKILVIVSIIFGFIVSISMMGYVNIYYIAGDLGGGSAYYLMFTSFVIVIETFLLFIVIPILYLKHLNKNI